MLLIESIHSSLFLIVCNFFDLYKICQDSFVRYVDMNM